MALLTESTTNIIKGSRLNSSTISPTAWSFDLEYIASFHLDFGAPAQPIDLTITAMNRVTPDRFYQESS
jgi:hypothetical protein